MFYYANTKNNNSITDFGPEPFIINLKKASKYNDTFRTSLWTGNKLQLTLMSIPVNGELV